ncbi:MAG: hypothetical protein ACFCVD_01035 [Nodosilinea sp.]
MTKFTRYAVTKGEFWKFSLLSVLILSSCRPTPPVVDLPLDEPTEPNIEQPIFQEPVPDSPTANRPSNFPIPSTWRGVASVQVAGQEVSVPIVLTFETPKHGEQNPFYFGVSIGNDMEEAGAAFLTSSINTVVARGNGVLGLQFLTIQPTNKGFRAVLTRTEKELGSAMNTFSGPNVTAQQGGIMSEIQAEVSGMNDLYVFNEGAVIDVEFQGKFLFGTIQGKGFSAVWGTSGIAYEAIFQVTQN